MDYIGLEDYCQYPNQIPITKLFLLFIVYLTGFH